MSSRQLEAVEALTAPLYFVAFLLVATPVLDFVSGVLPLRPANIEWRFASVGLLSGFLLTPLLGIILAMTVAAIAEHATFQRILAFANLAVTALFAILLVAFVLDIVQLRSVVQAEAKAQFQSAAWKAVVKYLAFLMALTWLALRGLKVRSTAPAAPRRKQAAVILGE